MEKEKIYRMCSFSSSRSDRPVIHFEMCGTTYPNRNYMISRSPSSISCIEYVVSGCGEVCVGGRQFCVQAGDTYFLPKGTDQFYQSDKKTPWEKIWVNLSGDTTLKMAELYGVHTVYHYPGLDTSDLLLKLQYYASRPEIENAEEKCNALIVQIFFRMSEFLHSPGKETQSPAQKMLLYIGQHETEAIRLEQLAGLCGKSLSQAERIFRKETGMPLYRYILNRRIELARQLLTETGMSVREIAAYLSFEDEYYFSGLFRQKTGVSPTQYRWGTVRQENQKPSSPQKESSQGTDTDLTGAQDG